MPLLVPEAQDPQVDSQLLSPQSPQVGMAARRTLPELGQRGVLVRWFPETAPQHPHPTLWTEISTGPVELSRSSWEVEVG